MDLSPLTQEHFSKFISLSISLSYCLSFSRRQGIFWQVHMGWADIKRQTNDTRATKAHVTGVVRCFGMPSFYLFPLLSSTSI